MNLNHFFQLANKYRRTNSGGAIVPAGVIWDSPTRSAFYADFSSDSTKKCIYRYDADADVTYSASIEGKSLGKPGFIIPVKTNPPLRKFVVGFRTFAGVVHWDGSSESAKFVEELYDVEDRLGPNERYGFGHRDLAGESLYAGTLDTRFCGAAANQSVYIKQRESSYRHVLSDLKLPIGYGFAHGNVYIIDGCTLKIWEIPNDCRGACTKKLALFSFDLFFFA